MGTIWRRSAVVVALVLVASLLSARGAEAAPRAVFIGTATSTADGHGTLDFLHLRGCPFVRTQSDTGFAGELDGIPGATAGDSGTLHIEQCAATPSSSIVGVGTFSLKTALGTLTGPLTSYWCICDDPVEFRMIVTKGTKAYAHARGLITVEAVTIFDGSGGFDGSATLEADVKADPPPLLSGTARAIQSTSSTVGGGGCPDVQAILDGTFTGRLEAKARTRGAYHVVECVDTAVSPMSGVGTFTLTTRSGTLEGTTATLTGVTPFSTWTVTGGTGAYEDATGSLFLVTFPGATTLFAAVNSS